MVPLTMVPNELEPMNCGGKFASSTRLAATRDLHLYLGLFLSPFLLVFAAFLAVNPKLAVTTRSRGSRGGMVWVR